MKTKEIQQKYFANKYPERWYVVREKEERKDCPTFKKNENKQEYCIYCGRWGYAYSEKKEE